MSHNSSKTLNLKAPFAGMVLIGFCVDVSSFLGEFRPSVTIVCIRPKRSWTGRYSEQKYLNCAFLLKVVSPKSFDRSCILHSDLWNDSEMPSNFNPSDGPSTDSPVWNLCLSFARNQQYPGAFFFAGLEAGYLAAMRDLEGWWVIVKHRHQNSLWRVRGSLSSCWMNSKEDSKEDLTKFRNLKMIILFLYCVCKYIIKHKITLHNMNKSNNII